MWSRLIIADKELTTEPREALYAAMSRDDDSPVVARVADNNAMVRGIDRAGLVGVSAGMKTVPDASGQLLTRPPESTMLWRERINWR